MIYVCVYMIMVLLCCFNVCVFVYLCVSLCICINKHVMTQVMMLKFVAIDDL